MRVGNDVIHPRKESNDMTKTSIPSAVALSDVDDAQFRNVVGHFASGVTVITTLVDGKPFGTTASAVSSLSMDPPMMLVCLNRTSSSHDALVSSGRYGINILAAEQDHLASHFGRKSDDKFAAVPHTISPRGIPLLDGALATIECRIDETATGGTHTIFLGRVLAADARAGEPLAYYRGKFGRLERAREKAAYSGTRDWVLRRRTPLGAALDVTTIADELRLEPELVHTALITLSSEALVGRTDAGDFTPTPLTADAVDDNYDARAAIETGVVETYLASMSDEQFAALRALGEAVDATTELSRENLDRFLDQNLEYHTQLVDLAGSAQLTESYRRMNVSTVWRETFNAEDWGPRLNDNRLQSITAAVANRDVEGAKRAIRSQTELIKIGAKAVIAANGGAV